MDAVSERALLGRVDQLERFVVALVALAALVPLLVGWVLPWYDEEHRDDATSRVRLVTQGFQLFAPPEGTERGSVGVLFGLGFLFLDVATIATAIMLIAIAQRSWISMRLGSWIVGLTCTCLVVVLILSLTAAGADGTTVHVSGPLVWGAGVVLSAVVYRSPTARTWWSAKTERQGAGPLLG